MTKKFFGLVNRNHDTTLTFCSKCVNILLKEVRFWRNFCLFNRYFGNHNINPCTLGWLQKQWLFTEHENNVVQGYMVCSREIHWKGIKLFKNTDFRREDVSYTWYMDWMSCSRRTHLRNLKLLIIPDFL